MTRNPNNTEEWTERQYFQMHFAVSFEAWAPSPTERALILIIRGGSKHKGKWSCSNFSTRTSTGRPARMQIGRRGGPWIDTRRDGAPAAPIISAKGCSPSAARDGLASQTGTTQRLSFVVKSKPSLKGQHSESSSTVRRFLEASSCVGTRRAQHQKEISQGSRKSTVVLKNRWKPRAKNPLEEHFERWYSDAVKQHIRQHKVGRREDSNTSHTNNLENPGQLSV